MKLLRQYLIVIAYTILSFGISTALQLLLLKSSFIPVEEQGGVFLQNLNSLHFMGLIVTQAAGFIIAAFLFLQMRWLDCFDFIWELSIKKVIIGFFILLGLNAVVSVLIHLTGQELNQYADLNRELLRQRPVAFLVTVGLVAPLYEEFVFRGIFLRSLLTDDSSRLQIFGAVFFSSTVFAILHIESATSLLILVPIFALAVFFSVVMLRTRNLAYPVALHSIQNFLAGLALLYAEVPPGL